MESRYQYTTKVHNPRAATIIVPILFEHISPNNVLDVGCGTGTWLKVFHEDYGFDDIVGLDAPYVDKRQLVIDPSFFQETDLSKPFDLRRKFDIALCLEVAEHLPEDCAKVLVDSLCRHSDTIVFSAAIPGQGGQNHLNEQWPDYWVKKFAVHGFYFHDSIRQIIWNNDEIEWWYRQNIFLVNRAPNTEEVMSIVHPQCFNQQIRNLRRLNSNIVEGDLGVVESLRIFLRSIRKKIILK